jgi:hypothetical protein
MTTNGRRHLESRMERHAELRKAVGKGDRELIWRKKRNMNAKGYAWHKCIKLKAQRTKKKKTRNEKQEKRRERYIMQLRQVAISCAPEKQQSIAARIRRHC